MFTALQTTPRPDLEDIFHPRSIAVAGVSSKPGGLHQGMTNGFVAALLDQKFEGPLYTVNPKMTEFMGLPCLPSVRDIPLDQIDFVISGVPAAATLDLLDACGEKGVRLMTFFTAGFSETGDPERTELERKVLAKARSLGIRILGPNCLGLYNPRAKVAFQSGFPKEPGSVTCISQSGANGSEFTHNAGARGVRFRHVFSYGNALDLNEADLFELAGSDPETSIVASYIEGVKGGARFARALRACGLRKPTIILKGGRTEAGSRAAHSHTASMAGKLRVLDDLCRQAGALRTNSLAELTDMVVAFSFLDSTLVGRNLALISGAGGPTVLAADDVDSAGLFAPPLSASSQAQLNEFNPAAGTSVRNPIDTPIFGNPDLVRRTLEIVAADPAIDLILYNAAVGGMLGSRRRSAEEQVERMLAPVRDVPRETGKPLAFVIGPPSSAEAHDTTALFQKKAAEEGFATFSSVARAARAIAAVMDRRDLVAEG